MKNRDFRFLIDEELAAALEATVIARNYAQQVNEGGGGIVTKWADRQRAKAADHLLRAVRIRAAMTELEIEL